MKVVDLKKTYEAERLTKEKSHGKLLFKILSQDQENPQVKSLKMLNPYAYLHTKFQNLVTRFWPVVYPSGKMKNKIVMSPRSGLYGLLCIHKIHFRQYCEKALQWTTCLQNKQLLFTL